MSDTSKRIWGTVGNLILALCNATLILLALCLWLAWNVVGTARSIATEVGTRIGDLQPVRVEMAALTGEVAALRASLEAMAAQEGGATVVALQGLRDQVVVMDQKFAGLNARLGAVIDDPTALIDHAIGTAATAAQAGISGLMNCSVPVEAGG